jgi:CheY-like chemotaxis protein
LVNDLAPDEFSESAIERMKKSVLLVDDGRQGYETARGQQPDLVLMDIQMPGLDGIETINLLKKDPATSRIPVLILTSLGSEEDLHRAREAGCQGFMNKPICKKELTQSIATLLNEDG